MTGKKSTSFNIDTDTHRRFKALAAKGTGSMSRELPKLVALGEAVYALSPSEQEIIEQAIARIIAERTEDEQAEKS